MKQKRRAYVLLEMLAVLTMVAVGSGLITSGILAIRKAQQRMVESANQTARTEDLIRCLSRDIRSASTARVGESDAAEASPVLTLEGEAVGKRTYRFLDDRVERTASPDGTVTPKLWEAMTARVSVERGDSARAQAVVSVTVFWRKTKQDDPRPNRRFDFAVRCAGERSHDVD